MNGIDHSFKCDGSKTNPVVSQVAIWDELVRVTAKGGLDTAIELWANRNEDGAGGNTFVDGELGEHVFSPELLQS